MMTRNWTRIERIVLGCVVVLAGFNLGGCESDVSDRDIATVDIAAVRKFIDSRQEGDTWLAIVDARAPEQYVQGHLPGAANLTITDLPDRAKLPTFIEEAKTVIVYGQDPASGLARGMAKRIYLAGQKGVQLFAGGFKAWQTAGFPVEKTGGDSSIKSAE